MLVSLYQGLHQIDDGSRIRIWDPITFPIECRPTRCRPPRHRPSVALLSPHLGGPRHIYSVEWEDLTCVCPVWAASLTMVKESSLSLATSDRSEASDTSISIPFRHLVFAYMFIHPVGRKCGCDGNTADQVTACLFFLLTLLRCRFTRTCI